MWGKQFFHFDVARWLRRRPGRPSRRRPAAATAATPLVAHEQLRRASRCPTRGSTPGTPPGTSAFHCVAIARVDPGFAKDQLLLLLREWYMHPNGQIPAYEWAFGDVNPPVHAWAALRVFEIDGARDFDFLARVLHKLLLNFTWWVNRKDTDGNNVFEGGFLGLDNIGPFDRSAALPVGGRAGAERRHRVDGDVRAQPARDGARPRRARPRPTRTSPPSSSSTSPTSPTPPTSRACGTSEDGFFYDVLRTADGQRRSR